MKIITYKTPKNNYQSNPDWDYMKMCGDIDRNPPDDWVQYSNPVKLIEHEYNHLMSAVSTKDTEMAIHDLCKLSVACLRLWRDIKR